MKQTATNLNLSHSISDYVWSQVQFWGPFSQTIIGGRFVQCLDEITVLLAQMKLKKSENTIYIEKVKLLREESLVWLDKSRRRRLLSNENYQKLYTQINSLKLE